MAKRYKDHTGKTFNNWTVLRLSPHWKSGRSGQSAIWECRCICGKVQDVDAFQLSQGRSKSCGCVNRSIFAEHKFCPECEMEKPHSEFYPSRAQKVGIYCKPCQSSLSARGYAANAEIRKRRAREYNAKIRRTIIAGYGGRCACCGEGREIFLALDHVNGGGKKEMESLGRSRMMRAVVAGGFPKKYQLLCHNCNWAKHHTRGNCPHNEPLWMPPTWGGFSATVL